MDEQTTPKEEYVPRPKWQIWLARIGVVTVIIGYILYCLQIAHPY